MSKVRPIKVVNEKMNEVIGEFPSIASLLAYVGTKHKMANSTLRFLNRKKINNYKLKIRNYGKCSSRIRSTTFYC